MMKSFLVCIFNLVLLASFALGEIRIGLNSDEHPNRWSVRNDSSDVRLDARVPGGIYSDLNLAQDLFYRQNDIVNRWVGYENWTYETTFELSAEVLNKTVINLVFHGIDTVGDVYVNGILIQSVDNMFVRYVIPIKEIVTEGNNTLEVRLKSPIQAGLDLSAEDGFRVPPNCSAPAQNGECHINYLRKMQASFSWDWGPAAPSVGIWKSVEIEAFNTAVVRDLVGTVTKNGSYFLINASCHLEGSDESSDWGNYRVRVGFMAPNISEIAQSEGFPKKITKNLFTYQTTFEAHENVVVMWWPNGYGDQPIYNLYCIFETQNEVDNEISSKNTNVAMRTVELVQEEIQEGVEGLSFYFKVNDVPIFAKGANWIPGHVLPELGYDERMLRRTLQSAKDAHMNMLRVWGGGVYESDLFYNIADELGIMIWQDMMFAVALYPTTEEFLKSVSIEIEQQVRRLASHPCIAIWAGNNENEMAIRGNWFGTANNSEEFIQDYVKLYVNTIKPIVEANDNSRWYVISSPSNGLKSVEDGYVAENPNSPLYGDMHYYDYSKDPWNSTLFSNTRFASEYGYQAMPSFITLSKVSEPDDWKLNSEFSQSRQHRGGGYNEITNLIKLRLPLPEDDGSEEFYKTYIYYSQISQAMAIKTESEKYRRDRNKLTDQNEGLTMGALYWQLNDVWQAPTWSSIEFGGKWKMLHYYAVKFFAPVIVVPEFQEGELEIYVVSDLLQDINVTLSVYVYNWDRLSPRITVTTNTSLSNSSSYIMERIILPDMDKGTYFIYCTISGENGIFSDNFYYPASFSDVTTLKPANISIAVGQGEATDEVLINLSTDGIAPFVWLEADEEGIFSDNGFTLIEETTQIKFSNRGEDIDVDRFRETLVVRSLLN